MSKLSKRLKELRNSKGLSQQALANEIGISKSSINMYERGEREPSVDTLELFADYYNVDMNYLLGNSSIPNTSLHLSEQINYPNIFPIKKHRIRLLGDIACGKPIYADEEREVYVDVGTDIKADFCLRAKGDSMINARIMDGDIVFIREQPMVNNGEIAAVIIDDEATLKRVFYYPEKQKLMLVPENTKYEPLVYIGEELEQIRILGLAVAFQSDL